jgi:hypothetical protein
VARKLTLKNLEIRIPNGSTSPIPNTYIQTMIFSEKNKPAIPILSQKTIPAMNIGYPFPASVDKSSRSCSKLKLDTSRSKKDQLHIPCFAAISIRFSYTAKVLKKNILPL